MTSNAVMMVSMVSSDNSPSAAAAEVAGASAAAGWAILARMQRLSPFHQDFGQWLTPCSRYRPATAAPAKNHAPQRSTVRERSKRLAEFRLRTPHNPKLFAHRSSELVGDRKVSRIGCTRCRRQCPHITDRLEHL